jgi:secreted trypsin-like serine protease
MKRTYFSLAGLCLLLGCQPESARDESGPRAEQIVNGGTPFKALQASVLELRFSRADSVTRGCSSTLVSGNLLLTAKHCLGVENAVVVGGVERPTTLVRQHPTMDLAVMKMENNVAAKLKSLGYVPMKLHTAKENSLSSSDLLLVAGYGIREVSVERSGTLLFGTMTFARFFASYKTSTDVYRNGLELAPSPSTACHGDSGGPVLQDRGDEGRGIIAVVSSGTGSEKVACDANGTVLVADVRPLRSWVLGS